MNLDELKPGPELDKLIAEKVMGYVVANHAHKKSTFVAASSQRAIEKARANGVDFWGWDDEGNNEFCYELPHYSTKIVCAWQVVEKLQGPKCCVEIMAENDGTFTCEIWKDDGQMWISISDKNEKTAPFAICIAALKVVENDS